MLEFFDREDIEIDKLVKKTYTSKNNKINGIVMNKL